MTTRWATTLLTAAALFLTAGNPTEFIPDPGRSIVNLAADRDGDGNNDTILCGDRDSDGVLEAADIRLCIDDVQGDADLQSLVELVNGEFYCNVCPDPLDADCTGLSTTFYDEDDDPPGAYDSDWDACVEIPSAVTLRLSPGTKILGRHAGWQSDSAQSQFSTIANLNNGSVTAVDRDITIEGSGWVTGGLPEGTLGIVSEDGTTTLLTSSGQSWGTNQWALPRYAHQITLRPSKSTREICDIASNTAETITCTGGTAFTVAPVKGDVFHVSYSWEDLLSTYGQIFRSRIGISLIGVIRPTVRGVKMAHTEHSCLYMSEVSDALVEGTFVEFCGGFLASELDPDGAGGAPDNPIFNGHYLFSREADCVDDYDTPSSPPGPQTSGSPDAKCDTILRDDETDFAQTIPAVLRGVRPPGNEGYRLIGNRGRYSGSNVQNMRTGNSAHMNGVFTANNYWVQGYPSSTNASHGGCVSPAGSGTVTDTICDGPGGLGLGQMEAGTTFVVDGYKQTCEESIQAPDCITIGSPIGVGSGVSQAEYVSLNNIKIEVNPILSTEGPVAPCLLLSNFGVKRFHLTNFEFSGCGGKGVQINPAEGSEFNTPDTELVIGPGRIRNTGLSNYNNYFIGSGVHLQNDTTNAHLFGLEITNTIGPAIELEDTHVDLRIENSRLNPQAYLFQGTATIASPPTCGASERGHTYGFTDAANATDCPGGTGGGSGRVNVCLCDGAGSWGDLSPGTGIFAGANTVLTRPRIEGVSILGACDINTHAIDFASTGVQVIDGYIGSTYMDDSWCDGVLTASRGLIAFSSAANGDMRFGRDVGCSGTIRSGFECIGGNDETRFASGRRYVSDGGSLDTGNEACPAPAKCLHVYDYGNPTTATLDLKTCSETVASGDHFEAICEGAL